MVTRDRIDHALAIAGQPDPNAVLLETVQELAAARGARPGWRADLITAVMKHP
ncbi:hypothetical protein ACFWPQ_48830 [Streptomyces sp. NPDC058464]|uniref:hypothetical protein n=1 Tax=Streptomyces sp. NPDC058464 TaxID=3346511 RepID=UPI00364CC8A7